MSRPFPAYKGDKPYIFVHEALNHLKSVANKGFIFGRKLKLEPLYQPLRDHPEWPGLLKESQKRGEAQRKIFFKLVADDPEVSLPEALVKKYGDA